MIDINELRRLTQEATPGPWKACRNHECYEGAYFEIDPEDEAGYAAKPFTRIEARTGVVAAAHDLFEFDRANAAFIAAANPAAISELLDRLEAAEKDIALKERIIDSLGSELNAVANERDELRAKNHQYEMRLRKILEAPEDTMSNSKALAEIIRQARLALGMKK